MQLDIRVDHTPAEVRADRGVHRHLVEAFAIVMMDTNVMASRIITIQPQIRVTITASRVVSSNTFGACLSST